MSKPAERSPKTAGLAIAAFMQKDFHKSTRSIEVSTYDLGSATEQVIEVV